MSKEQHQQQSSFSLLSIFAIAIPVLFAIWFGNFFDPKSSEKVIFSKSELYQYSATGTKSNEQLLLSVLGRVFLLTRGDWEGEKHQKVLRLYGPGGSYSGFTGRDGSRAFITGDFSESGLTDNLEGLSDKELSEIETWREFYKKDYTQIGVLIGPFYDEHGHETAFLKSIEERIKNGIKEKKNLESGIKQEEKEFPNCNFEWSQEKGGEAWCSNQDSLPRFIFSPSLHKQRCACILKEVALQDTSNKFSLYPNCDPTSNRCKY